MNIPISRPSPLPSRAATVPPLGVCIAGLGGFGAAHHAAVQQLENENVLRLLATCDPHLDGLHAENATFALAERQVGLFPDFGMMLEKFAAQSDLVTIATPIAVHAPMHAASVNHRMACYLEKPPTLDPDELERMIQTDQKAQFQTQVGFSGIVEPWRQILKRRLLAGEFGEMKTITFIGGWQRTEAYYRRTPWAGKLMFGEHLLLDSCFGNAMAHHAHNALFMAGRDGFFSWATPESVRAELYRANPIEGADTVFSEAVTTHGVRLQMGMTHACLSDRLCQERIVCRDAEIRIVSHKSVQIHHASGRHEILELGPRRNNLLENLRHYAGYLRGAEERPLTTLADARPFVWWNALNYVAAGGIHTIREPYRTSHCTVSGESRAWIIPGIEKVLHDFFESGLFPSTLNLPWAAGGGFAALGHLSSLRSAALGLQHGKPAYSNA